MPPLSLQFPIPIPHPTLNLSRDDQANPPSSVATEKLSATQEDSLLANQRLNRPLSPHMQIYDPAQTFFTPSIWTRITGGALSASLYVYSGLYLVSPLVGWHIESSAAVAAFAAMPFVVKGAIKTAIAWPFVFHLLNGIRHFAYDAVYGFTKPQIKLWAKIIGWTSGAVAVGLGFLY